MKTYKFEERTATVNSERLLNLLSDNNNVDSRKDHDLTLLYRTVDFLGNKLDGAEIDLTVTSNNGMEKTYSLDKYKNSKFEVKGFKYGKLCDVIGISNPTSFWME